MVKVIIRGNTSVYIGSAYCEALGIYSNLEDAYTDAETYAYDIWDPDDTEDSFDDEGPEYCLEEYDLEKHDGLRYGGGSFEEDFARMKI